VYERDLVLVKGKGAALYDKEGRAYVDFAAGIGVNGLGYGDAKVVAAIRKQAGQLIHASNLFHTEPTALLAQRLVSSAFPSKVFFCNSGTEAFEAAMKFARKVGRPAGRTEFVCFERAFHGRTMGALSATWNPKYREPFEPLVPGVRFCPWNDLDAARAAVSDKTAAIMVEPVQGEGGVRPAPADFLQGLRRIADESGAVLVLDEIQCGLGRTGKMFAFEHAGIVPDVLTLAKPLGGGLPMGAVLLHEKHAPAIGVGDHGSTFGGNPVAAAASLVVLDRLTAPGFLGKVEKKARALHRGLQKLRRGYPKAIAEVRGLGLMVGIELHGEAGPVVKGLRERGFLATKAGDKVLRLLPPLVVKPGEIRAFLGALEETLKEGAGH
ncbi:MAG TPA: aspartate aminotransferase family protein, partial [Vicinamibacteria bacterium]